MHQPEKQPPSCVDIEASISPIQESSLVNVAPAIALEVATQYNRWLLVDQNYQYGQHSLPLLQTINHFKQLILGSLLGAGLTFSLIGFEATSQARVPLTPLLQSHASLAPSILQTLEQLQSTAPEQNVQPIAPPPPPAPATKPTLQPVMMDRFYLPVYQYVDSQGQPFEAPIVVDRFYFAAAAESTSNSPTSRAIQPGIQEAQALLQQPLYAVDSFQSNQNFPNEGTLAVPFMPPQQQPEKVAPTYISPPLNTARVTPFAQAYTLTGVMQTDSLSAALFRTPNNSYTVRLGETIGQSQFTLVSIKDGVAILSDGQHQLILHVGDSF